MPGQLPAARRYYPPFRSNVDADTRLSDVLALMVLLVKRSTLGPEAGMGLFTSVALKEGDVIGDYKQGTFKLTKEQFERKYPRGGATKTALINGFYYDGYGHTSRLAKANRAPSGGRNNAKLNKEGMVVVTAPIKAHGEIFMSYGPSYRIAKPTAKPAKK